MGDYSATMEELSGLLETQSGQNSKLLTDNTNLGEQMSKLIGETQKREEQFVRIQTEYGLQIKLFEAQLKKAQLEKAEVKCEMTQERIDLAKELETERGRNSNLERTVTNLREQLDIYEVTAFIKYIKIPEIGAYSPSTRYLLIFSLTEAVK